jgi:hypothetical protein
MIQENSPIRKDFLRRILEKTSMAEPEARSDAGLFFKTRHEASLPPSGGTLVGRLLSRPYYVWQKPRSSDSCHRAITRKVG